MKPIIGIVAPLSIDDGRPFENCTKFVNNYPKRIIESGGEAIGLLFPYGKFDPSICDLCDGFIIQGGKSIESFSISLIDYAIKNNKPVLGICLGMQTMAAYEWMCSNFDFLTYENIDNYYDYSYENNILKYYDGHDKVNPFYIKNIDLAKHNIKLYKNSRLYDIYKGDINMPSLHKQVVIESIIKNKYFMVTGKSLDGVIEVLESVDPNLWIVGVQFHPELEDKSINIFKEFIKEVKKRQFDKK